MTWHGEKDALELLRWNWGDAYRIWYANGLYHAARRDDGAQVHAPDTDQLDHEIEVDYRARPVPRDLPVIPLERAR
ncbi:MAG TPA: hypothetical protein VMV92_45340 [Streptosporangiaceae bacterium]|nr:hypothetical protein [Streptosporangiaceae bacterium]